MDNFDVDLFAKYLLHENFGGTNSGPTPFEFSDYGDESDDLISVNNTGDDYLGDSFLKGSYLSENSFPQPIVSIPMTQPSNLIPISTTVNPLPCTSTVTNDVQFQRMAPDPVNATSFPLVPQPNQAGPSVFNYLVTLPSVTPTTGGINTMESETFSLLPSQVQHHGLTGMQVPITMATMQKETKPRMSNKRSAPVDAFEFLMQEHEREDDDEEEVEERTPTGRPKKKKSIVQKERRRERNRVLAKKTRDKKRGYLETLQMEVLALQKENHKLRDLVKSEVANSADILQNCNALESLPESVLEACNEMEKADPEQLFDMATRMKKSQHAFIITDPSLPDNPIVFASGDFLTLTGYDRSQVLGRNCRFLQGPQTSNAKIDAIRTAMEKGEDVSVTLLNYRADASPFWNQLFIAALRNGNNEIVNYMGVVVEVSGPAPDDPEHGKALPAREATNSSTPSPGVDTAAVG